MLYVITTTSLDPIPKSQLLVNKLKINIVHEIITITTINFFLQFTLYLL
jgi:hypothetical protein